MPNYRRYDQQGNVVEEYIMTPEEAAAEQDAERERQLDAIDIAQLRALFNHENRLRALTRALRATSTAANNAANAQGLPTAAQSADLTPAQFRAAIKSLL